jgi:hypothetical protein
MKKQGNEKKKKKKKTTPISALHSLLSQFCNIDTDTLGTLSFHQPRHIERKKLGDIDFFPFKLKSKQLYSSCR